MDTGDRVTIGKINGKRHADTGKTGVIIRPWGRIGWFVKLDDGSGGIAVESQEINLTKPKPRRKKK